MFAKWKYLAEEEGDKHVDFDVGNGMRMTGETTQPLPDQD
jgi:hypothetical protein